MKITEKLLDLTVKATIAVTKPSTPYTGQAMQPGVLYRVPLSGSVCSNGTQNCMYLRKGASDRLLIFFIGGGVVWSAASAAKPVSLEALANKETGLYIPDMSAVSEFGLSFENGKGLFSRRKDNPFCDWNVAMITYATGDFHVGNGALLYTDRLGRQQQMLFAGQRNFEKSLQVIQAHFPNPEQLLIAGSSAGGFGAAAHTGEILTAYPACKDVTLCADASFLPWNGWKGVVRKLWNANASLANAVQTDDLMADLFRYMKAAHRDIRCLFICSNQDYLLTTLTNDIRRDVLNHQITKADCEAFCIALKQHVKALKKIDPQFGVYIHACREKGVKTGTRHCILSTDSFHKTDIDNVTPAKWLYDAVCGQVYDVGLHLL